MWNLLTLISHKLFIDLGETPIRDAINNKVIREMSFVDWRNAQNYHIDIKSVGMRGQVTTHFEMSFTDSDELLSHSRIHVQKLQ